MIQKNIPNIEKLVDQDLVNLYADVAKDNNPLHMDPVVAENTIFKKPIAHGMLILAFISEAMTLAYPDEWYESGSIDVKWKGAAIQPILVKTVIEYIEIKGKTVFYNVKCFNEVDELLLEGTVTVEKTN